MPFVSFETDLAISGLHSQAEDCKCSNFISVHSLLDISYWDQIGKIHFVHKYFHGLSWW